MIAPSLVLAGLLLAQQPATVPESTDFERTSTNADVHAFLEQLSRAPNSTRLRTHRFGFTALGRDLDCVVASLDASRTPAEFRAGARLRALILANIHGGEVEGKEAVLRLLREIAYGEHEDLLQRVDLLFVPVFNADGNDAIDPSNRPSQNGPNGGVGQRHNAQDLDLNRDYIKAESPEVRAQLALLQAFDPHLYMDLHTTNGSDHGYQLTYAPALSTTLDPELDAFTHDEFMPSVRAAMLERHAMRTFDYGNFSDGGQGEGHANGWYTFDHKPRLGWNYVGLRNRISVLSEAYSYLPFSERIAVTHAFVLETIRALVDRERQAREIFAHADERVLRRDAPRPSIGFDSEFAPPRITNVLISDVARVETEHGVRRVAGPSWRDKPETPVYVRFEPRRSIPMPSAWAIVGANSLIRQTLLLHGIEVHRLSEPTDVEAECFWPTSVAKPRLRFQGHRMLRIRGEIAKSRRELPAGTLIVSGHQRLARLAAMLLDPHSEDSLAVWNFFDDAIRVVDEIDPDAPLAFPILRLGRTPNATRRCDLDQEHLVNPNLLSPRPPEGDVLIVSIHCTDPGLRVDGPFERAARWQGRKVRYRFGANEYDDTTALERAIRQARPDTDAVVIVPDARVVDREILLVAESLRRCGVEHLHLDVSKHE
ncbi:MAG: M14 family metallopeptidase [Planctomycetes bacterium]|nr:M14 family metallopeptidase [Planctomycetota bacterium]